MCQHRQNHFAFHLSVSQLLSFQLASRRCSSNAGLSSSASQLSEVVVTAGGLKLRKKEQGYASTTVKPASLTAAKPVNAIAGLNGKVAGLRINATGSGVNPNYRIVLRGMRSLTW
jgi:hypothetical protein